MAWVNICDIIYPIGAYYISHDNTHPGELFGGTWTAVTNRFLYASTSSGTTGGSSKHTHKYGIQYGAYYGDTIFESDSNAGCLIYDSSGNITFSSHTSMGAQSIKRNSGTGASWTDAAAADHLRDVGTASYTSTLPPYVTCYCWRRTA